MKIRILFLIGLASAILLINHSSFAQTTLSKSERKAIKKEIKKYKKDPESYAEMKDKNEKKILALEEEIHSLSLQLMALVERTDSLAYLLSASNKSLAEARLSELNCGKLPSEGTVYSVQIGNYKKLDLSNSFNINKGLRTENYSGGNAYVIGNFISVSDAVQFAKDLKKLGITDTFVTKYSDGERIINFDAGKDN